MDDSGQKLRRGLVEFTNRPLPQPHEPPGPPRWLQVWTLFSEDKRFTDLVKDCAELMLHKRLDIQAA